MFGLGWPEILLILVIALVVLGPRKLPEVAKGLGKLFAEFRRTTDEVRDSIELEVRKADEAARLEAAQARAKEREARAAAALSSEAAAAIRTDPTPAQGAVPTGGGVIPPSPTPTPSLPPTPTPTPVAAGVPPAAAPPSSVEKVQKEEDGSGR